MGRKPEWTHWSKKTLDNFFQAFGTGASVRSIAYASGVTPWTLRRWIEKAEDAAEGKYDDNPLQKEQWMVIYHGYSKARGTVELRAANALQKLIGKGDRQAIIFQLEASAPEQWARGKYLSAELNKERIRALKEIRRGEGGLILVPSDAMASLNPEDAQLFGAMLAKLGMRTQIKRDLAGALTDEELNKELGNAVTKDTPKG